MDNQQNFGTHPKWRRQFEAAAVTCVHVEFVAGAPDVSTSLIYPEKVRAYLATQYRLGHTDNDIVLTVGEYSDRLATLFDSASVECGAFLTAYNPQGRQQTDDANDVAHANLAAMLLQIGMQVIEGSGSEEGTDWPVERSYFALGLGFEDAASIGRKFDQDAIVWVGRDAVPKLILLR